jgi:hypothetical protein
MALKTTNTTTFNLDVNEIIEEAFERCGQELRSGYDFRTARRSLNLMLMDWANRGINLWTIEEGQIVLTAGISEYDIPVDTVDLLDHVIRTGTGQNQIDITISRISGSVYAAIPNKNATGKPIQVYIDRQTGATNANNTVLKPRFYVWPVPNNATCYTFVYWRLRRIFDAGSGTNGQDIPFRFMPCMIAGLAYHLALKLPGSEVRIPMLKSMYDEAWQAAADEDRDKSALRLVPLNYG